MAKRTKNNRHPRVAVPLQQDMVLQEGREKSLLSQWKQDVDKFQGSKLGLLHICDKVKHYINEQEMYVEGLWDDLLDELDEVKINIPFEDVVRKRDETK